MIRWQFIGVRLLVLIAMLLLLRWTAGPIVQWLAVQGMQSATGAKVEIASTEVGFFPPMLHLVGVSVADPKKEMENAVEFDDIYLSIDGAALLNRRYEVSSARLKGIRVGTDRADSGFLEIVQEESDEQPSGPSLVERWCEKLAGNAENEADAFVEQLSTITEAKRIRDAWEAEYDSLRAKAQQLESDVKNLKGSIRAIENPLRDLPELQATLQKVEALKNELTLVRDKLDTLPSRVRQDLNNLEAAKNTDRELIASYLPADLNDGSATKLGPELLGRVVRDQLQVVRNYLDSGRSIAQITVSGPKAQRERGETILMRPEQPTWMVRRCEVDGFLKVNTDEYTLLGVVENLASNPERISAPLHARMRLEGPRVVRIDYQRFYDASIPRDHLKVHWPNMDLPASQFSADETALSINGGRLELWVDIDSQGNEISGRLVSRQKGTRLQLSTKAEISDNIVVQSLQRKLDEIDRIDVDARFAGTWKQMDLEISTSLTSHLSQCLNSVVDETMVAAREKLAARLETVYQEQSTELASWLNQQQADARKLLAVVDTAVESTSKNVMAELSTPDAYLSRLRTGVGRAFK